LIKNIQKLDGEIAKTKTRLTNLTNHLRDLERWKREAENAEIVATVRGMEVTPDALKAFINASKHQFKEEENPVNET